MIFFSVVLLVCFAAQPSFSSEATEFDYNMQQGWPGVCTSSSDNQQSPIDITTGDVRVGSSLSALQFNAWDVSYNGSFVNSGHNVQFNPTTPGAATTINHLGTYDLQQFHMHWGRRAGEGSEHRIDQEQAELEIHFVHYKQGATDPTEKGYITVVGVLGDVDEGAAITGPFAKLDVTEIQSNDSSGTAVTGLVLDQLLPNNRDYYYYQGSLTTPPCTEIVEWFVLKERINVSSTFLEQLRAVQQTDGEVLEFNFRDIQSLGDRVVMTASQAINKPFIALLMLSLVFVTTIL